MKIYTLKLTILIILLIPSLVSHAQWKPDSLLQRYSCLTVSHSDDYQGHVVSTIIRHDSIVDRHRGILYIHGFNDYFFQAALGDSAIAHQWNFRAIDLRRYGRSLRDGNKRFQVRNLREYYPDIDSAVVEMNRSGIDTIVLLAHSTGGLIASLYMNNTPRPSIKALVLNSPFLDWNMNSFNRNFLIPVVSCIGSHFPNIPIKQSPSTAYSESLLAGYNGEWHYDTSKKLMVSPSVSSGWVHAIQSAQKWLHRNSDIKVPILLMHSSQCADNDTYNNGDAVLDVKHIAKWGVLLGPDVTEATVPNGLHDLILSKKPIRDAVYHTLFKWLEKKL
ncbi:MAG: alpha/beta hydrolase [Clostridiales bacterium]|nr:alpha/beta hydrolase [Clostridiales bacterium]